MGPAVILLLGTTVSGLGRCSPSLVPPCCRRIARATGATVVSTLADMEGNETFEASQLGQADEVVEQRVSDDTMTVSCQTGGGQGRKGESRESRA